MLHHPGRWFLFRCPIAFDMFLNARDRVAGNSELAVTKRDKYGKVFRYSFQLFSRKRQPPKCVSVLGHPVPSNDTQIPEQPKAFRPWINFKRTNTTRAKMQQSLDRVTCKHFDGKQKINITTKKIWKQTVKIRFACIVIHDIRLFTSSVTKFAVQLFTGDDSFQSHLNAVGTSGCWEYTERLGSYASLP